MAVKYWFHTDGFKTFDPMSRSNISADGHWSRSYKKWVNNLYFNINPKEMHFFIKILNICIQCRSRSARFKDNHKTLQYDQSKVMKCNFLKKRDNEIKVSGYVFKRRNLRNEETKKSFLIFYIYLLKSHLILLYQTHCSCFSFTIKFLYMHMAILVYNCPIDWLRKET